MTKIKPYIPKELPIDDIIDIKSLFNSVVTANMKLGIYNEKLKSSKIRKELLLNLFELKEAVESSKIEGTQSTIDDIFEYRADGKGNNDIVETMNYFMALKKGVDLLDKLPISTRFICEIHKILLSGNVRGGNKSPGEYRTIQNWLGENGANIDKATYIPPEPQLVNFYMSNLENYINDDEIGIDNLIKIAIIHAQFETIHPFKDGNGRVGRLLIPFFLYDKKLIDSANIFISETLEKDKFRYYQLLNNYRIDGERGINEWIKFFIDSIIKQLEKDIEKINAINKLYEDILKICYDNFKSLIIIDIINIIFEYPIFNSSIIKERLDIPTSTLNNYLNKLVELRIIYPNSKSRNRKFYFYDLIGLIR
ncbi:MAG: Fic family protein [Veillonella sp.]|uniref:Fic family protein n=1 Tax=Veillonella sp. TaxID=1926307 RepID=UPI00290100B2|nr:Fic family protein [Veillonella sp.]MDU2702392.1 Fic family protein [Veillonella sp.]